jgi:hypothetical protein
MLLETVKRTTVSQFYCSIYPAAATDNDRTMEQDGLATKGHIRGESAICTQSEHFQGVPHPSAIQ